MANSLRQYRKDRKLTLVELSAKVGLSHSQLSRIELDGTHSLPTALKLVEVTGLPVETFAPKAERP
jgi:transcriptional regulator with XRE-family HTH domain